MEAIINGVDGRARALTMKLPHGDVQTPVFMPVGTHANIKGVTATQMGSDPIQCKLLLANTYHLALKPGAIAIKKLGGIHNFMNWNGNLLTDSGGFQMVSLLSLANITEEGVEFQSPADGTKMLLTPEESIRTQHCIGSDIIMALDDVVHSCTNDRERFIEATHRTVRWLDRCIAEHHRCGGNDVGTNTNSSVFGGTFSLNNDDDNNASNTSFNSEKNKEEADNESATTSGKRESYEGRDGQLENLREDKGLKKQRKRNPMGPTHQNLFAIVQGGLDVSEGGLREICLEEFAKRDHLIPGYAIGGLAGGESKDSFWRVVELCTRKLPANKPRYLMGVGYPMDIVVCVALGVDMFDSVFPTRTARFGTALTLRGPLKLKSSAFANDTSVIEEECDCCVCCGKTVLKNQINTPSEERDTSQKTNRSQIHQLLKLDNQVLATSLITNHNLTFMLRLGRLLREAILEKRFPEFVKYVVKIQYEQPTPQWIVEALNAAGIDINN